MLVSRYTPIKTCLHKVPAAIEQRGTDWPEEWPKRLETFPEWLGDKQDKLHADDHHWKAIFNRSYLNGMGIDWSNIRNVMDMKAIYGGYASVLHYNVYVLFLMFIMIFWFRIYCQELSISCFDSGHVECLCI